MLAQLVEAVGEVPFREPATPAGLASAAAAWGEVPAALVELWSETAGSAPFWRTRVRFLSPEEAVEAWRAQVAYAREEGLLDEEYVSGGCHMKVFDPRWIPFAADGVEPGDYDHLYCLDGYPSSDGALGQVILVHHLEGLHVRVALSLHAFLGVIKDEIQAEREAADATLAAEQSREAAIRPAVEAVLARFRAAGVDLGPADDLAEDPTFAIGQAGEWTPEVHGARLFLARTDGLSFRGRVGLEGWRDYVVQAVESWTPALTASSALAPYIDSMRTGWNQVSMGTRADAIVDEVNRLLAGAEDSRRLWAVSGKGAPYVTRYVLLTEAQKDRLAEDELVVFSSEPGSPGPEGNGSGLMGKLRRFFSS